MATPIFKLGLCAVVEEPNSSTLRLTAELDIERGGGCLPLGMIV